MKRVLKPTGSLWLNIGDAYQRKSLVGLPWRIALALTDRQGWILRNSVIWNKVKGGPDHAKDKLRNVHENVLHFVKSDRYFYDTDAIRCKPGQAKVINGAVVSATGVSGVRYRRQIELSTALDEDEKQAAGKALDIILDEVRLGKLSDFRMIIRGQQRATHSDSEEVSGRARDWLNAASISSNTIPTALNRVMFGTFFRRIRRKGSSTSHPTPRICAGSRSARLVQREAWCWTRLPVQARRTWWPFGWAASRSASRCLPSISGSPKRGAGCFYEESRSSITLKLKERISTDTGGIALCLGLRADSKVELQTMLKQIEAKLPQSTLLTIGGGPVPVPEVTAIAAEES